MGRIKQFIGIRVTRDAREREREREENDAEIARFFVFSNLRTNVDLEINVDSRGNGRTRRL